YDPPGGASGCQLTDLLRAWGLSLGCAFTRAPDGGDGLETVPGQVTTIRVNHRSRQNSQDNPGQSQEQAE
ncbi:unnamed protein product, partial [Staurois parvus]